MSHRIPLIGITACAKPPIDGELSERTHSVGESYILAVAQVAGGMPMLIPAMPGGIDGRTLIGMLDGLLFTGSPSNVEPIHYRGEQSQPGTLHDPLRDAVTLPLIRMAIGSGLPLLCLCRGHQELNVALGGTLHQRVHEVPGRFDHREPADADWDTSFGPAHMVTLTSGGLMWRLAGERDQVEVNSLHSQAIDRLAPGLSVEAVAPDGTIEGVRVSDAPAFALGCQFHPEFRTKENPFFSTLFQAFGDAARAHAARRAAKAA